MNARDREVRKLVSRSLSEAWSFDRDLPWDTRPDPERVDTGLRTLLEEFAPVRKMSARERTALAFSEGVHHLSSLLAGERSGEKLAAQVLALGTSDVEMLAIIAQEEAKHYLALERYLLETAARVEKPDRTLAGVIAALEASASPEVKLLVGQVILEWTAASLLATLIARVREPLLRAVLRTNLRDESRHVAYGVLLRPLLSQAFSRAKPRREMEELAFEAVVASARALLAGGAWRRAGLPVRAARLHALAVLQKSGVLERYTRLVPLQLERCGFPAARLAARLERDLVPLMESHA